jgi:hypothetical protein
MPPHGGVPSAQVAEVVGDAEDVVLVNVVLVEVVLVDVVLVDGELTDGDELESVVLEDDDELVDDKEIYVVDVADPMEVTEKLDNGSQIP